MKRNYFKAVQLVVCMAVLTACGGDHKPGKNNEKTSPAEQAIQLSNKETSGNKISGEQDKIKHFEQVTSELQNQVNILLDDYSELKKQLTESSAEGAAGAAKSFLSKIENFKPAGLPGEQQKYYSEKTEAIKKFIQNTSENPKLEAQREHFFAITKNMYALTKSFKAGKEDLYYQYCPMAFNNNGGYWISKSKEIKNPYFGEKMLKCGQITETLSHN